METFQAIITRRSIRKYTDQPVGEERVAQLLESARLAPSGSNTQPWHFIVVRSEAKKRKLAEISHKQDWMATAPVHIVCVADIRARIGGNDVVSVDENSPQFELKQIIRDTAIAVDHMVLEAEGPSTGGYRTVVTIYPDGRVMVPFSSYGGANSGIPIDALTTSEFRSAADSLFGFTGTEQMARTAPGWLSASTLEAMWTFCTQVVEAYAAALELEATADDLSAPPAGGV